MIIITITSGTTVRTRKDEVLATGVVVHPPPITRSQERKERFPVRLLSFSLVFFSIFFNMFHMHVFTQNV
jgi:hypothetical protein